MKGTVVYFLFAILTCYTIQADDLLTSSLDTNDHNLTPCINHTDCDGFQDGKCVNSFCECNGTKFCEDKTDTIVTKLGESCKIDSDCNIEHSVCKENKCACDEGRVEASDERRCLTAADALGNTCEDSIQCYTKIPHSGCQNEKCVCQQQMHEHEGVCYRNAGLGEKCQLLGECSATPYSDCINEKCICKEGYVQNHHANRCLEVQTKMGGHCYEDIQCSTKFGKAICKLSHCQCEELYQYKLTRGICVRDLLLGERCENHTDCHGPEVGESRSECILGECKCKSEFIEEHGYCTSGGIPIVHIPSILLFVVLVLCALFNTNPFVLWGSLAYSIFYMFWITFLGRYFTDNNNYMNDKNPKSE